MQTRSGAHTAQKSPITSHRTENKPTTSSWFAKPNVTGLQPPPPDCNSGPFR